jgi:hypothetical protein
MPRAAENSPMGGDIAGPDDPLFDPEGNLYASEITEGRVSVLAANGRMRRSEFAIPKMPNGGLQV